MAVSLATAPPSISFSKNQIALVVQSPSADYLAAAAAYSVGYVEIGAAVTAGTIMAIAWGSGSATMTAATSPDESGRQFPAGDGSNTYVASLLPWFRGNYFIDQNFTLDTDFTHTYPRIRFTAKKQTADLDLNTSAITGVTTHGATNQPVANFAHFVQLLITAGSFTNQEAYTAIVPLDGLNTGNSTLDIHDQLHPFLATDMPVLSSVSAACTKSVGYFVVKYGQYKGSPAAVGRVYTSPQYFIAKGGLSIQPAALRDIVAELCPSPGVTRHNLFLRSGSKVKTVTADQPEWLYYLNLTPADVVANLEVKIYYSDNTIYSFNAVTGLAIARFAKYQFQAGYMQLQIATKQPAKTPVYYTVRLKGAADYLTDSYAYVIDNVYRQYAKHFIYENAYGGYNTLTTIGIAKPEFDRNKTDAQLVVSQPQKATIGELLESNITFQEKNTVAIGYERSDPRIIKSLRELLTSYNKFLWKNGRLIPIGFNTKNIKETPDGVNVYSTSIEYYPLYQEEVYTPMDPQPDNDLDQTVADGGSTPLPVNILVDVNGNYLVTPEGEKIQLP